MLLKFAWRSRATGGQQNCFHTNYFQHSAAVHLQCCWIPAFMCSEGQALLFAEFSHPVHALEKRGLCFQLLLQPQLREKLALSVLNTKSGATVSRYIKCFTFAFVIELLSVALEQQRSFRPSIHFCQSVSIALFWLLLLFKHFAISFPLPVLVVTRDLCSCVRIMLCSAGSEKVACAALCLWDCWIQLPAAWSHCCGGVGGCRSRVPTQPQHSSRSARGAHCSNSSLVTPMLSR